MADTAREGSLQGTEYKTKKGNWTAILRNRLSAKASLLHKISHLFPILSSRHLHLILQKSSI